MDTAEAVVPAPAAAPAQSTFAKYAWQYIERGISVVPIAPGSKKPGVYDRASGWRGMSDWTRFATRMPTDREIEYWSTFQDAGIGIVLGPISNLVGVDRDYDTDGTDALDALIPYTPFKKKGEKGYTAFFQFNGERSCSFNINGVRVMDVLAEGRQTVVPPTMHPTGCAYVWTGELPLTDIDSPLDLPKLPDDFIAQVEKVIAPYQNDEDRKYQKKHIAPREDGDRINTGLTLHAEYFRDINRLALDQLEAWVPKLIDTAVSHKGGYRCKATWRNAENRNVGVSPAGIFDFGGNYGMTAIDLVMYSRQVPFNGAVDLLRACLTMPEVEEITFAPAVKDDADPVVVPIRPASPPPATVLPWLQPVKVEPAPKVFVPSETSAAPEAAMPAFLKNPPGILGEITRWIIATAPKEQPELALAAAIALCSVVMARSYSTQFGNLTSLYLVMVAKSTEGKEHPQSAIEKILSAAGLSSLRGGSGYTSAGGLHTALLKAPAHIALIDEMGKLLKLSRSKGNSHSEAALDKLVEAFGRLDGVMTPPTYSSMTAPKVSVDASAANRDVYYPAITILGATTPGTFYANLSDDLVKDGFLGRCIVVESKRPRQLTQFVKRTDPPQSIVDWCKKVHASNAGLGNLAGISMAELAPALIPLPFSDGCMEILAALDKAMNDAKDQAEATGLDALYGRTVEKAMRLSMIVAKARNIDATEIGHDDLKWAIEFAQHFDMALVHAVQECRYENEHQKNANKVLDFIRRSKSFVGSTKNKQYQEIMRGGGIPKSWLMQRMHMKAKDLKDLIGTMQEAEQIKLGPAGGGFTGDVYYLVQD